MDRESDVKQIDHSANAQGPDPIPDGPDNSSVFQIENFGPGASVASRPRVMMLGLRGIPNVQGGVEKHVEMLASELMECGWNVDVIGRRRYLPSQAAYRWKGIQVFPLWAPRRMALEAIAHTFLGVCFAAIRRPDILHVHAVGPALLVPLARILGLKVVVTHHGYDYDRQKWGGFAKRMLKLGERVGMRFSNSRIAISQDIAMSITERYRVTTALIPNGVSTPTGNKKTGILEEFGLQSQRYILLAARLVPEKRQTDLIRAFAALNSSDVMLVLAGAAEFESAYAQDVKSLTEQIPGVVMTGFQTGDRLAELFANASLFVLPSSHEGMPIALLEALSYGLPVLASDIVANRQLLLAPDDYFPLGNIEALAAAMTVKLANPSGPKQVRAPIQHEANYGWHKVAQETIVVYRGVIA